MLLRNKIIFIMIFVLLAIPVISDNRYEQVGTVLQCLKRSLYDFLINPNSPEVRPKEEIIDLINFYLGINPAVITVDVSGQAPEPPSRQTTKTIREILGSIPNCEFPAMCSDGTKFAECSAGNYPKYCYAGELIDKCTECGCDAGDYCNTATYQCQSSSDYIKCSVQYGGICSSSDYSGSSDYIERRYCIGNDVYRNYTKAVCINPNTPSSYCGNETIPVLLKECTEGCTNGACGDPTLITTCAELQAMRDDLSGYYQLTASFDCTGYDFGDGKGFKPIGDYYNPFTGILIGNGNTISNLNINRPYPSYPEFFGLFGVLDDGALISDVKLENVNIIGSNAVGALAGYVIDGIIDAVEVSGGNIQGNTIVGGMIGEIYKGAITNILSTSQVTGSESVGGLVGTIMGYSLYGGHSVVIDDGHSTGNVNGGLYIGGLVGDCNECLIINSDATGDVTSTLFASHAGGLVGFAKDSDIDNSYSTGAVSGNEMVGGLIGSNYYGSITNSYSTGAVTGNNRVGGLIGYTVYSPSITNSYSTGAVSGNEMVGGLVGWAETSKIIDSHSTSTVTGTGSTKKQVGGLIGYIGTYTEISRSYSEGSVSGNDQVGGLVGQTDNSIITDSYSTSNINGVNQVGGLVGYASSSTEIKESYSAATAGITATGNEVGGLVGKLDTSKITDSYSKSNVQGNAQIGGLVGKSFDSSQTNTYSTGNVVATGIMVGGLIGSATGSQQIINSYSTGEVSGITPPPLGGLVGIFSGGTITNDYWYNILNNCCGSGTCTGCTKASSVNDFYNPTHNVYDTNPPTWDFADIWQATATYPTLK